MREIKKPDAGASANISDLEAELLHTRYAGMKDVALILLPEIVLQIEPCAWHVSISSHLTLGMRRKQTSMMSDSYWLKDNLEPWPLIDIFLLTSVCLKHKVTKVS